MKRMVCTICLMLILLVNGCTYIGVLGGQGGEFDSASISLEYGFKTDELTKPKPGERDHLFIGGTTYIDTEVDTWFYNSGAEFGSYVKYGLEVVPDTGLFATVLGGVTWRRYTTIWGGEETDWNGMFGGGVSYFIDDGSFNVQANFDNRRGFTIGAGWRF